MAQGAIRGRRRHAPTAATNKAQREAQRQHSAKKYSAGSTRGPATKAGVRLRTPSETALNAGAYAAERVSDRAATIRTGFVRSERPGERPPLARMLVGGQGGEVRLKLYLSMLFIAVAPPYATKFPARGWAALFDLPSPAEEGARRVRDAQRWLEQQRFVRVVRRPGYEPEVVLLADDGSGKAFGRVSKDEGDIWVKVPAKLWSKGWIAALSGRAIAIQLVLLDYAGHLGKLGTPVWLRPERATELYSLSPETWARGSAELEAHGLLVTEMKYFRDNPLGSFRRRKEYTLNLGRLSTPPAARKACPDGEVYRDGS